MPHLLITLHLHSKTLMRLLTRVKVTHPTTHPSPLKRLKALPPRATCLITRLLLDRKLVILGPVELVSITTKENEDSYRAASVRISRITEALYEVSSPARSINIRIA